ncbi:MAG: TonB-dependent receptor [Saonia sp.]
MKYLLSILCIIVYCFNLSAQDCTDVLTGEIVDFHDKTPLAGATVQVVASNKGVLSDLQGKFLISGLCSGIYELEISHPECPTRFITVSVSGNTFQKITMEHHLEELGEVVVTGEDSRNISSTVNTQSLKAAEIERYSAGSLGDALKEISGVSSLNTGSTIVKPVIQGLNSSRILVIANDIRLQDQEWGIEHAPNIDLNTADKLTVVKGSGALQYGGDAIGGIVLAQPKRLATRDTIFGKTLLSGASNGRGGSITTSLDKGFKNGFGMRLQGTYKRFGDFRAPDYFLTNTGTEQKSVSLNLGFNKFTYGMELYYSYFDTKIGILRAADFGNITDLVRAINAPEPAFTEGFSYTIAPPRQEVAHHLLKAKTFLRLEGLGKVSLQYAFQMNDRQEFDNRRGVDDNVPTVDLELVTHSLDLLFDADAMENTKISAGVSGIYQENFADPATGVRRVIPDYERFNIGFFGGVKHRLTDVLELDVGGRIDFNRIDAQKFYRTSFWESRNYDEDFADIVTEDFGTQLLTNPVFDYTTFSATLGVGWQLDDYTNVLLNYGLASRAPNASELFSEGLNQSSAAFELGDLRIGKETSNKVSLLFKSVLFEDKLKLEITPYANFIADFIVLEPTGVLATNRGTFQVFEYLQNNARLVGIDVDLSYRLSEPFELTSSFSYLRGDDTTRDTPIINIPPANFFNTLSYTNPKWRDISLSIRSELFFEQSRFPDNNFIAQIVENNEFVDVLVDVSTPPPSYHLLHFDSSVLLWDGASRLELGFGIDNILNTNYRQYLNRFRFFADDLGRNFRLSLKINY